MQRHIDVAIVVGHLHRRAFGRRGHVVRIDLHEIVDGLRQLPHLIVEMPINFWRTTAETQRVKLFPLFVGECGLDGAGGGRYVLRACVGGHRQQQTGCEAHDERMKTHAGMTRNYRRSSSKKLSARGSLDCPSQNMACLRTSGCGFDRANVISTGTPSPPGSRLNANTACFFTDMSGSRSMASPMVVSARGSARCAIQNSERSRRRAFAPLRARSSSSAVAAGSLWRPS